jgi:hypothetical protein
MINNPEPLSTAPRRLSGKTLKPGMCNVPVHMPEEARTVLGRAAVLTHSKSTSRAALRWIQGGLARQLPRAGVAFQEAIVRTFGESVVENGTDHTVRESQHDFVESI